MQDLYPGSQTVYLALFLLEFVEWDGEEWTSPNDPSKRQAKLDMIQNALDDNEAPAAEAVDWFVAVEKDPVVRKMWRRLKLELPRLQKRQREGS